MKPSTTPHGPREATSATMRESPDARARRDGGSVTPAEAEGTSRNGDVRPVWVGVLLSGRSHPTLTSVVSVCFPPTLGRPVAAPGARGDRVVLSARSAAGGEPD